jgi:hypothetical protein
MISKT